MRYNSGLVKFDALISPQNPIAKYCHITYYARISKHTQICGRINHQGCVLLHRDFLVRHSTQELIGRGFRLRTTRDCSTCCPGSGIAHFRAICRRLVRLWLSARAVVRRVEQALRLERWDPCLYVADLLVGHGHVMRASALTAGLGCFPVSRCRLCWSRAYQRHAGTSPDFAVEWAMQRRE